MATLAGLSTTIGAGVVYLMPHSGPPPAAIAFALSLAAGVMITVSLEMVLPEWHSGEDDHDHGHDHGHSHHDHGTTAWWWPLVVFFIGVLATFIVSKGADLIQYL